VLRTCPRGSACGRARAAKYRGTQAFSGTVDCADLAAGLQQCPELEQLNLHNVYLNCEKNAQVLAAVSKLHSLSHIDLRGTCAGEATVAQLLCTLPQLPGLRRLLLGINSLYGPANQARAPRLRLRACLVGSCMQTSRVRARTGPRTGSKSSCAAPARLPGRKLYAD
jgi:hypothetical protein